MRSTNKEELDRVPTDRRLLMIPIETKVREFDGKLLQSLFAAVSGFDVFLGAQKNLIAFSATQRPGIYLDKSVAETKLPAFRQIKAAGHVLAAWDEEGLVYFDDPTYVRMRFSEEAFRQVEVFFAWGDAQLEAIAAHRPETRARIRVTGNPRFDLLRPEWRPYFAAAADELRKAHGKFILVNTNFAFANHFNGEEGVRRLWASYSISREPGFYEGWADMNRRNLESFSRMLPRLRSEFPDHKIVIRPHPSENFDTWRAISAGMPSVLVSGEGSAVNWIIASELLVHSNCTTAIEAFLLEKPAIAYRACSPDRYDQPLPNALSIQVFDEDSLFRSAREWIGRPWTVGQSPADAERTAVAARHIASRSGPTAAERIAAALASLPRTEGTVPRHGSQPVSFPRRIWRMWLRFFRSRYRHNSAYASHKFPGLSTDEVRAGIAGFSAISPGFRHIRAEQVAPSVFRIVDDHDRTETADARPHGIRPAGVSSMTRAEGA